MTKGAKQISLASGTERGFSWNLRIAVFSLSSNFTGAFKLESEEEAYKRKIRNNDQHWVRKHLLASYRGEFEIHHNWQNGARMQLVTPVRHRELDAEISAKEEGGEKQCLLNRK